MRSLERVNIRTNVRTYSHTYVRDRPYIPSTTLLCEGIITEIPDMVFCSVSLTQQGHDVVLMSMRRNDDKSTSLRRHFDFMCLPGRCLGEHSG